MVRDETFTLMAAARILDEAPHRLIYLCEKSVVVPDIEDSRGRGSSRRFSARNLLEFGVALRLRAVGIAVEVIGAVLYGLRAFEEEVQKRVPTFRLPESLQGEKAPDLRIIIGDGSRLYASLGRPGKAPKLLGPLALDELTWGDARPPAGHHLDTVLRRLGRSTGRRDPASGFGEPEGSEFTRVEVSITRIAVELAAAEAEKSG